VSQTTDINALRSQSAPGTQVAPKAPQTTAQLLASPKIQAQIQAALPKHMTPERMARIATTEIRKNPKLAQCEPLSFIGAVIQCAQLGLEPGSALGHAYILPFDVKKKERGEWVTVRTDAQVIVGYRGMIDLARRSGQIQSINARVVHAGDKFSYAYGLDEHLTHVPTEGTAGPATHFYAVAKFKDGGFQFDVMTISSVHRIRDETQGYKAYLAAKAKGYKADTPWLKDEDEMGRKTVLRRLFKYLPVSVELQRAVLLDEQADHNIDQGNESVIDGEFHRVEDEPQMEDDSPADAPPPSDDKTATEPESKAPPINDKPAPAAPKERKARNMGNLS